MKEPLPGHFSRAVAHASLLSISAYILLNLILILNVTINDTTPSIVIVQCPLNIQFRDKSISDELLNITVNNFQRYKNTSS